MIDKTAEDWADAIEAQLLDKWCGDNEYCQSRTGDVAAALRTAHDKGRARGMREACVSFESYDGPTYTREIHALADKLDPVPTKPQTRKELP